MQCASEQMECRLLLVTKISCGNSECSSVQERLLLDTGEHPRALHEPLPGWTQTRGTPAHAALGSPPCG